MSNEYKIISYRESSEVIRNEQVKGSVVVFASGGFDIVHIGHKRFLEAARELGDALVIGVESDETLLLNKGGKRPFNKTADRVELLSAFSCVTYIFPFEDVVVYGRNESFVERFRLLHPDIFALSRNEQYWKSKMWQIQNAGIKAIFIENNLNRSSTNVLQYIGYE